MFACMQFPENNEAVTGEPVSGVAVHATGLVRSYGMRRVLDNLQLTIEAGGFLGIVGRSGCGKSTLLRLLAGLDVADQGTVNYDEQPSTGVSALSRIMFQEARLLPWQSVLDNVAIGLKGRRGEVRDRARAALAEVGLLARAEDWPRQLSGGQKQRVALARALVTRPRFLLLDEPLGALDALTRIEMQRLIERIWLQHRFTALLVTHDVSEAAALADRIVLIEAGRIDLDLPVGLPRPRSRGSAAFAAIESEVLQRLLGEA